MNAPIAAPNPREFHKFQQLIQEKAGIYLSAQKVHLLNGRLSKRLQLNACRSYSDYFDLITSRGGNQELEIAIDLITTNETYFFREPKHFEFLEQQVLRKRSGDDTLRIWSAACSSGEEPYSIAMSVAAQCTTPWEILASDISEDVLVRARKAIYQDQRTAGISQAQRKRFCRRGIGEYDGCFRIAPDLRQRVNFQKINLIEQLPDVGVFDVIFLRNVMIYFERHTQQMLVAKLSQHIKPGGYLMVGHSESLQGISDQFRAVQPAIYQRV